MADPSRNRQSGSITLACARSSRNRKKTSSPSTKVWVTDPAHRIRNKIEWLRYEPDSPICEEFMNSPHVAYAVDDLERAHRRERRLPRAFDVGDPPFATVPSPGRMASSIEYMQFKPGRHWFNRAERPSMLAGDSHLREEYHDG